MVSAATKHWPEYLIEAVPLGLFMVSPCSFTVLLNRSGRASDQTRPATRVCSHGGSLAIGMQEKLRDTSFVIERFY